MQQPIRLNKFLAERLGWSRREADDKIAAGAVLVDGRTAELGTRISPTQTVTYDDKPVPFTKQYTYLLLHKPVGFLCSRRAQGDVATLYSLLPSKYRQLKSVGRLDRDSSGLILLTDDGDFAFKMTHPKFAKLKIYEVILDTALLPQHQQLMSEKGVEIGDGLSRLALSPLGMEGKKWQVRMQEGRNRQIRRSFAALGYTVVALHRVQFGNYSLDDLEPGKWKLVA